MGKRRIHKVAKMDYRYFPARASSHGGQLSLAVLLSGHEPGEDVGMSLGLGRPPLACRGQVGWKAELVLRREVESSGGCASGDFRPHCSSGVQEG